jgi:alcohol dehydrogenase class IV
MSHHGDKLVGCSDASPLFGVWIPHAHLKQLFYGPSCVERHLVGVLASATSRVFIVTGQSLAAKTPLIRQLEALLGERHAGTFAGIKQHGDAAGVDQAFAAVSANPSIDTLLSVGGGSPIDAAKVVSYRINEQRGSFLTHIAIPTTLSAAECTPGGGYTRQDGTKIGFMSAGMGLSAIFYDPVFTRHTPRNLLLGSGMRAVDHAVESVYHPNASLMPWKAMACWALGVLFQYLPRVAAYLDGSDVASSRQQQDAAGAAGSMQADGADVDDALTILMLAAFASSGFRGANFGGGMGLSHSLGHALGSPYGIPRKYTRPPHVVACRFPTWQAALRPFLFRGTKVTLTRHCCRRRNKLPHLSPCRPTACIAAASGCIADQSLPAPGDWSTALRGRAHRLHGFREQPGTAYLPAGIETAIAL